MSDKEWKEKIGKIDDPVEMLVAILENEDYLGYDPYYGDLRATLLNQAEIIVQNRNRKLQSHGSQGLAPPRCS